MQGAGDVKLKLRIPTDGSVDLDELRRALERHRDRKPHPLAPEPEVIPEPEVLPAPDPKVIREPSWLVTWLAQNKLLAAAIGSAVIAFISGVTWLTQSSSTAGASALLVWTFWLNIIFLCGAFGQILRTHLAAQPKIDEPSETWLWVRKNSVTVVALFSAVTAFVVGLLWVGQYTAANKSQPALVWAFWILVGVFCAAFSFVFKKQLAVEGSLSSTVWEKIKERPVVLLSSVVGVAAIVALVFFGLSKLQTSPSTEVAKGDPVPTKSVKPNPQPPLPIEPPPVKPPKKGEPATPPTKPEPPVVEETSGPAPGWGGRLMSTGVASSLLFGGLFLVTRQRKKKFPDEEALQQGASLGHIRFFRGLRYFIAGHGGFYLVAAMVGLLVTVIQLPVGLGLGVLLSLLTIPVAAGAVMALGYAGVNLMPTLDLKVGRSHSSAPVRFLKQKALLASVLGLTLAAIMVLLKNESLLIETWGPLALENSVTYGFMVALLWKMGNLVVKHESVKLPESKAPWRARTALYFNLPLWGGLTLLTNFILIGITELSWRDFWWLSFITGAVLAGLVALLRCYQILLVRFHFIIVTAGIVTFALSVLLGGEFPFWKVFVGGIVCLAAAVRVYENGLNGVSGRFFIVPPNNAPFKKVIETTRDGVIVQWGKFTAAVTFLLLFTATALSWVWGSN